jgi:aspartokinase/homoserine dehydrogenase 1
MIKEVNIFLVGTGNVGSAFLKLLASRSKIGNGKFHFRVIGIANRSGMYISTKGIKPDNWKSTVKQKGEPTKIESFIETMKKINLANSVFIDCTDNDIICRHYEKILQLFPIVTPNKSANSDSYKKYLSIRKTVQKYKTDFKYSANVGVGLPSLDIINSLIAGGDKINSIEGLFSSTMNYLLDKLQTTDKSFSRLLLEAKEKGLSEPDPRNDLNGIDTARKILILAREVGAKIEMTDIKVENLVPKILRNIKSLNNFYDSIKIFDRKFDELKKIAVRSNRKFVYVARYRDNKVSVGIEMTDATHPFYSASADEKVVLLYTDFYKDHPLVIKGQSGGATATAEVLLSDIIKIIKRK